MLLEAAPTWNQFALAIFLVVVVVGVLKALAHRLLADSDEEEVDKLIQDRWNE